MNCHVVSPSSRCENALPLARLKKLGKLSSAAAAGKCLHHLASGQKLFNQPIDLRHAGSTAARDPLLPAAINDGMIPTFAESHGVNDGRHATDLLLGCASSRHFFQALPAWEHADNLIQRA